MITIAYANPDQPIAERIAADLEADDYPFGEIQMGAVLVAVISPRGLKDEDLFQTIEHALDAGARVVLVATEPVTLPALLDHLTPVSMTGGYHYSRVRAAVDEALTSDGRPLRVRTSTVKGRNMRWGLAMGLGLLALFGFYTWAIVVFDIEAPAEEFQRAYTHSAATVGAFAQPFLPQSTEQAENFETTLQAREVSDELATVIVQTATQAATEGGFVPLPTGMIIAPAEQSIVRQTATGGAIIRATQTAQAENDAFNEVAATATAAAATANAQLEQQNLTVTAASEAQ